MEIQYEMLKKWVEFSRDLNEISLVPILNDVAWNTLSNGDAPVLSNEQESQIINAINSRKVSDFCDSTLWVELTEEMDYNISIITNKEHITRYLKYFRSTISQVIDWIKDDLGYVWLKMYFTDDVPITEEDIKSALSYTGASNNDTSLFFPTQQQIDQYRKVYYSDKDRLNGDASLIEKHANSCFHIIYSYEGILDEIKIREDSLNASESMADHVGQGVKLTADRHKLILLQKTGVFEFLTNRYLDPGQPLMKKEDFQKLISQIIGATTKDIGSDVGKLHLENIDPKKPKTVETEAAVKKVKAFLSGLGLTDLS